MEENYNHLEKWHKALGDLILVQQDDSLVEAGGAKKIKPYQVKEPKKKTSKKAEAGRDEASNAL